MKRLLTKSIATAVLAGTVLAPTAAHAFPFNPIGIARGAADMLAPTADHALPGNPIGAVRGVAGQLPVTPLSLTAHSKAAPEVPAGVVEKATSAAGTIRETLPVDLDSLPLPVSPASPAQSAVSLPGMVPTPCRITPVVNAPVELARHLISFAPDRVC